MRGEAFQINSEICLLVIVLSPAHSCSPIFPSIFSPGYVFTTLRPLAIHAHTRVPTYTHRVMETVYYIIRDFCFCGKLVSNPHFSLVIVFPISWTNDDTCLLLPVLPIKNTSYSFREIAWSMRCRAIITFFCWGEKRMICQIETTGKTDCWIRSEDIIRCTLQ